MNDEEMYYDPNLEKKLQQDFHKEHLEESLLITCYKLIQIIKDKVPDVLIKNQLKILERKVKKFQKVCKLPE